MKLKSSTLLRGQKQLQMRFLIKFVVQLVDVFNLDANDETLMACTWFSKIVLMMMKKIDVGWDCLQRNVNSATVNTIGSK